MGRITAAARLVNNKSSTEINVESMTFTDAAILIPVLTSGNKI